MKIRALLALTLLLTILLVINIVYANESQQFNAIAFFQNMESQLNQRFNEQESSLINQWEHLEANENSKWEEFEQEIINRWGYFHPSTPVKWVQYSENKDSVNVVDFRKGKVTLESLVSKELSEEAKKKTLAQQLKQLLTEKDYSDKPILQSMLQRGVVDSEIDQSTIKNAVDADEKIKISTTLNMVPDHIARRAQRYYDIVLKEAKENNLDPALIMAVIHTESAFNPMARSSAPAYGLMQLMPEWGAKEAYQELYGEEKYLPPQYLYKPANNIKLGAKYLRILNEKYFSHIKDPEKRRYLVISAYNWGPTRINQQILSKVNVNRLNKYDLYSNLHNSLPRETKDYLERVEQRIQIYQNDERFTA